MNETESLQSLNVSLTRARAWNRYVVAGVNPLSKMGAFTLESGIVVHGVPATALATV
jgi:hypothetical protein